MVDYGIEVEAIVNNSFIEDAGLVRGDYHHGNSMCAGWKIERDSSISSRGEFNDTLNIEFVSTVCRGRHAFSKRLQKFKGEFTTFSERLSDVLAFNSSCGCHIHFSIPKGVGRKAWYNHFTELRDDYFSRIDSSTILSAPLKRKLRKHYFRGYATKLKKEEWLKGTGDRSKEFNFQSESSNKGMEWRSINLLGVTTWNEFFEVLETAADCIETFISKIQKYEVKEKICFNRSEVSRLFENV